MTDNVIELTELKGRLTPEERKARRRKILRILLIGLGGALVVGAVIGIVKVLT